MSSSPRTLLRDLLSILAGSAVLLVARASLADHYVVPTGSMIPTVDVGDHVCVNKAAYGLRVPLTERYLVEGPGPAHGDVVVLSSPTNGDVLLKRVVAVPGDVVEVSDGRVAIDGHWVPRREQGGGVVEQLGEHAHLLGTEYGGGPDFGPRVVPAGDYLVLGDNRGNSLDGRFFGWVSREAILGKAVSICFRGGVPSWNVL